MGRNVPHSFQNMRLSRRDAMNGCFVIKGFTVQLALDGPMKCRYSQHALILMNDDIKWINEQPNLFISIVVFIDFGDTFKLSYRIPKSIPYEDYQLLLEAKSGKGQGLNATRRPVGCYRKIHRSPSPLRHSPCKSAAVVLCACRSELPLVYISRGNLREFGCRFLTPWTV